MEEGSVKERKNPNYLLIVVADSNGHNGKSLKRSFSNTKTDANNHNGALPEYLHPGSSERPLMALLPHTSQPEVHAHILHFNTTRLGHFKTERINSVMFISAAPQLFKGHIS